MRIVLSLVVACALSLPYAVNAQSTNCTKSSCEATVIVPASCANGIKVAPDPIYVEMEDVPMKWVIRSSPGWLFDRKGIDFYGSAVFPISGGEGTTTFTVTSKNTRSMGKGAHKYDINLYRMVPMPGRDPIKETCKLDPTVVNQ